VVKERAKERGWLDIRKKERDQPNTKRKERQTTFETEPEGRKGVFAKMKERAMSLSVAKHL
jgi:hypothetical protein